MIRIATSGPPIGNPVLLFLLFLRLSAAFAKDDQPPRDLTIGSPPSQSPAPSSSPSMPSPSSNLPPTGSPTTTPLCVTVVDWSTLEAAIQFATAPIVLCSFFISKPTTAGAIVVGSSKEISCFVPGSCVVSGPGTHLSLSGLSQLTIRGFEFRQATTSSIVVSSGRQQVFQDCVWRSNSRTTSGGGGGGILMHQGSSVSIIDCMFRANSAPSGGAIWHAGASLLISGTVFENNRASAGGGGIAVASSSVTIPELHLDASTRFTSNKDNSARRKSGAIRASTTDGIVIDPSTSGSGNDGCNGLYIAPRKACVPFILVPYKFGRLIMRDHGILFSQGLVMEIVATSGQSVKFSSPTAKRRRSSLNFHYFPDGAAIVPLDESDGGGFVYVSNSESLKDAGGGVYALYFDPSGRPRDYKRLLGGTSWNCNGGLTPWNTWVSCEEYPGGHCYQTDPRGQRPPEKTKLGGASGGQFEEVAVNNDRPAAPVFYLSEDKSDGAIRRWRPAPGSPIGWNMLHGNGVLDYLEFLPGQRFQWTTNLARARTSAYNFYRNVEGIVYRNRNLMFASKAQLEFFILNLSTGTWRKMSSRIGNTTLGGSTLDGQADQLSLDASNALYVGEDGGSRPGLFVQRGGQFFEMLQLEADKYIEEDVTGVSFSPDGRLMFFCAQDEGLLFRVRRIDGGVLEGTDVRLVLRH